MAATICCTLPGSVPSEKFGTHSIIASGFIAASLPPGISQRELDAGIHPWVSVSETGAGYVHSVGAEVEGAVGAEEVVDTYATLGGEVTHAGVCVGAVVDDVEGEAPVGRVLVVGPEDAAGGLCPGGDTAFACEVPPEDGGGEGHAGEGASDRVERGAGEGAGVE